MNINSDNIDFLIKSVKQQLEEPHSTRSFLVVPFMTRTDEIDYKKYKGKGRPRNTDYKLIFPVQELEEYLRVSKGNPFN